MRRPKSCFTNIVSGLGSTPSRLAEPSRPPPPSRHRRQRVAYLCGEPFGSPIHRFLSPLLRHHDRRQFKLKLYCTDRFLLKRLASECSLPTAYSAMLVKPPSPSPSKCVTIESTSSLTSRVITAAAPSSPLLCALPQFKSPFRTTLAPRAFRKWIIFSPTNGFAPPNLAHQHPE